MRCSRLAFCFATRERLNATVMRNEIIRKPLHDMCITLDDAKLLHTFIEEDVEFMVIGGVATQFYGCRKSDEVDDLDLLLNPTNQNVKKLCSALAKLNLNTPLDISHVINPRVQLRIKHPPYNTDLLSPSKEQNFTTVYENSIESNFKHHKARVISKDELIKMKVDVIKNTQDDLEKHNKDLDCLKSHNQALHPSAKSGAG